MELRIEPVAIPEKFSFNYDELKQELTEKARIYEALVYDDKQIKEAKADRADLNRLKKALNDERIRREKEYMQPFNAFKAQINEIIGIIDKPVKLIDERIKDFEEQQKQEKKKKIEECFNASNPYDWLNLQQFFDNRWLNSSVSAKSIQEAIKEKFDTIGGDLIILSDLPEFSFEAIETYKTTLDLNKSIAEGHRLSEMQKRKAEQEKAGIAATVTPEESKESAEAYREAANVGGVHMSEELSKQWVSFKALLSVADATALKEFFENRNIEFSRI